MPHCSKLIRRMFLYCFNSFVFCFLMSGGSLPVVRFAVLPSVRGFLLSKECQRLFTLQLELPALSFFSKIQLAGSVTARFLYCNSLKRRGIFLCTYQQCFIYRPSDSIVSEDAGMEPRTVATLALSHSQPDALTTRLDLIHIG